MPGKFTGRCILLVSLLLTVLWSFPAGHGEDMPLFGRDTVLVWEIPGKDFTKDFVVRIAAYSPDLLMEWEDEKSQGTVFISRREIMEAKGYVTNKLFKSGMDANAEDETTVWLSRRLYRDLKEKKEAKVKIDRVQGRMIYLGEGEYTVEVNGSPMKFPVIKVQDSRKAELWFLDREDNPLMVQYRMRQYRKTLVSVTTNRKNTLRWIKGPKLERMLQD
ncbi:MAG: hypothetical protein JXR49_18310 [Acidobacteria bacterium]|nr:hypothetical protein [Acidobacteriota bacterium]